jgi:hypothetical protein
MTGCNGDILQYTDCAFLDEDAANRYGEERSHYYPDDPNYIVYVNGPIPINET